MASWTTTSTSAAEEGRPTSKSVELRAYQTVGQTKPRKIENQSLKVMAAMMTKVETIWEEAAVVHPCHASIVERQVTSQWIALNLKRSEEVAAIEAQ